PDEDWAETFAVWMTPGLDWRAPHAPRPGGLAKVGGCDPAVRAPARPAPPGAARGPGGGGRRVGPSPGPEVGTRAPARRGVPPGRSRTGWTGRGGPSSRTSPSRTAGHVGRPPN